MAPRVDLRDQPAITGSPSPQPVRLRSSSKIVGYGLAEAEAGIDDDALAQRCPRASAAATALGEKRADFRDHVAVARLRCIVRGLTACASGTRQRTVAPQPRALRRTQRADGR